MKQIWKTAGVIGVLSVLAQPGAYAGKADPGGVCGGGDGHTVPTPFEAANQKFELADGELYYLHGRVTFLPADEVEFGKPYLMINFDKAPWLGNAARVASPYYALRGNVSRWKKWNSLSIKVLCRAHVTYVMNHDGYVHSEIELEPVAIQK